MSVKKVWITENAERLIAKIARVSNPANQNNHNIEKLLKYCLTNGHVSIFEQASLCVEIKTSRAISAQLLRHRTFVFQEFSQRYSENTEICIYSARRQDTKNRQNSIDDLDSDTKEWFKNAQRYINEQSLDLYKEALNKGIAKELARMMLPMATATTLYMTGNIRSWIHYVTVRSHESTQLEHRRIAEQVKQILCHELPIIGSLLS